MRLRCLLLVLSLVAAPVVPSFDTGRLAASDRRILRDECVSWTACTVVILRWRVQRALAQDADVSAKEAFEAAKELGTVEAWQAFLARYPDGFYADLAQAYLKKLGGARPAAAPPAAQRDNREPRNTEAPPGRVPPTAPAAAREAARPAAGSDAGGDGALAPTDPRRPAVARGASYMGFPEQFNRYYTDPAWKPSRTMYVSPDGRGNGASRSSPMAPAAAVAAARPGTLIHFVRGTYQGCFEFSKESSGTYDDPIVLYAERNEDKSIGVKMTCCGSGPRACFNLENADYIAVDGFELIGGQYGVRAVGASYAVRDHTRGVAVIDCKGHDQERDPLFSGPVDWAVWERNVAYGAKKGDGHGMYLAGDWHIVRFNETYGNASSDFQINADPDNTCKEVGIQFDDPRCDGYAGEGEGGQGASDYFLVDSNYFHHSAVGPNFTSVRRSVIRNNIFGPQTRHNVSFWQQTDNPKLGSSDNKILHNLFITTERHGVKFENNSTRNEFVNNIIIGVRLSGDGAAANPSALLMEVDDTVGDNVYRSNLYVSGKVEGRAPSEQEAVLAEFSPAWFLRFPVRMNHDPMDFRPTAGAPFLGMGRLSPDAPADRTGSARSGAVDLGPIEVP